MDIIAHCTSFQEKIYVFEWKFYLSLLYTWWLIVAKYDLMMTD